MAMMMSAMLMVRLRPASNLVSLMSRWCWDQVACLKCSFQKRVTQLRLWSFVKNDQLSMWSFVKNEGHRQKIGVHSRVLSFIN
jgi:hypothetical protein